MKCPVQNNEIASCSLTGDAYATMWSIGSHYLGGPGFSERTVSIYFFTTEIKYVSMIP